MDNKLLERMQQLCDINPLFEEIEDENEYNYEEKIKQVEMSSGDDIEDNISKMLVNVEITNDNGEVTVIIQKEDLLDTKQDIDSVINELNNDKEKYKDLIDISDVVDGDYRINDYEVSKQDGNIILNIDFTVK